MSDFLMQKCVMIYDIGERRVSVIAMASWCWPPVNFVLLILFDSTRRQDN